MNTREELNEKYESLKKEVFELSEEEFDETTGGTLPHIDPWEDPKDPAEPEAIIKIMCRYYNYCTHTGDKNSCPHYTGNTVCRY